MPCAFQASSILRYSVILFCRFLAPARLSGLMFSSPMKTRVTPARLAFSMKFGILWQSVSTWIIRPSGMPCFSRSSISRSKIGSQSLLRAKLSSVMKNLEMPCCPVQAHQMLDVVGRAEARLAALHVDDGAERALVRTAAAGVEAGAQAERALDVALGQERHRRALDAGQVVHEIVERQRACLSAASRRTMSSRPSASPANIDDAQLAAGVEFDRAAVQHRQAARDMEAAHDDRDAGGAERPRDIERAGILVRLHADQPDQAEAAVALEAREQRRHVDAGVGLVDRLDLDLDVRAEHLPLGAIAGDAVNRGQRIRRNRRAPPADDVAVVAVVRRLDQNEQELTWRTRPRQVGSMSCKEAPCGEWIDVANRQLSLRTRQCGRARSVAEEPLAGFRIGCYPSPTQGNSPAKSPSGRHYRAIAA